MHKPELQYDHPVRVVALQNLEAMCEHVSGGMCHKFTVTHVGKTSASVTYSNEDEHGRARPFRMVFKAYQRAGTWGRTDTFIMLEPSRTVGETPDHGGEGWQSFLPVIDCPPMYRDADGAWHVVPAKAA